MRVSPKVSFWIGLAACGVLSVATLLYAEPFGQRFYQLKHGEVSLGDVFNGFMVVLGIYAAFVAVWQLYLTRLTARATFLKDLYTELFSDADIRRGYYDIERGDFPFVEGALDPDQERAVDRLLAFADLVCSLHKRHELTDEEMGAFDYEFETVYRSKDVRDYMKWLGSLQKETPAARFGDFDAYCRSRCWSLERSEGNPKWRHKSLKRNLAQMLPVVEGHLGTDFRESLEAEIRGSIGAPLRQRLSRVETSIPSHPAASFYGELVGSVGWQMQRARAGEILPALAPFFDWEHGVYALGRGMDRVGWRRVGLWLADDPGAGVGLVPAVWCVGLLDIGGWNQEAQEEARGLGEEAGSGNLAEACASLEARCTRVFRGFAQDEWRLPIPPDSWSLHRRRLWLNAVTMAKSRAVDGGDEYLATFQQLLAHVAGGGRWPLPCDAEAKYESDHAAASGFRGHRPTPPDCQTRWGCEWIGFLDDPLEVLNIGNAFSTCLRLAPPGPDESTRQLLGWATSPNVRIIAAKDGDSVVARRTLGLVTDGTLGAVASPLYPPDAPAKVAGGIAEFGRGFLADCRLNWVPHTNQRGQSRVVADVCAATYNDAWEESDPFA